MAKSAALPDYFLPVLYIASNIIVASAIVFANKAVFQTYHFSFVLTLTWVHAIFTWVGMSLMERIGFFQKKELSQWKLIPLTFGFVGYIVLCNLSLNLNTVGFYQIMKIAITPVIIALEFVMFRKFPSMKILIAVGIVCVGVSLATVSDSLAIKNTEGLLVGVAATVVTALYQIWAGSKQKELQATSSQLLAAYTPQAIVVLSILIPVCEPVGWTDPKADTLLGYDFTTMAVFAIFISSILGILVSFTTFLVIGSTSSLTYNVVGHIKTVIILAGGCILFGDTMPWKKLYGVCIAMLGIGWYTLLITSPSMPSASAADSKDEALQEKKESP